MSNPRPPRRRPGVLAHGMAIQLALSLLASGKVSTKSEAARIAGCDETSLKPSALRRFAANNPIGRELSLSHTNPEFLTITADVGGKRVSAKEALVRGTEQSIVVLAKLGPRIGRLTKSQRAAFLDAKRWIDLCRNSGLFAPAPIPANLPGELTPSPDSAPIPESVPGAIADFVEDGDPSVEDEGTAEYCKVEA